MILAGTEREIPLGFCQCGCGQKTKIADQSISNRGITKGDPNEYVRGHQSGRCRTAKDLSQSPEWKAYWSARDRCTNPENKQYYRYGDRGIEFRFASFEEFLIEAGLRPSPAHSIDRENNEGHYEKGNIRWATRSQQQRNKSAGITEKNRSSKYLGVHWDKDRKKWFAQVSYNQKRISLGRHQTQEEAARARDSFVREHKLNWPMNFTE